MPFPLLAPLWLASAGLGSPSFAPDEVDAVQMPWWRYEDLVERAEGRAGPAPRAWASEREVELQRVEGGWELKARWILRAGTPSWIWQELLGPGIELRSATLDGRRAPVVALPGSTTLAAWIDDDTGRGVELRVRAFVPADSTERLDLRLMPATRGQLRATAPGRVLVPVAESVEGDAPPVRAGGVIWSGAADLPLQLRDPDHVPPEREALAVAHAGVGLTVGDAELRGRAHLQWELRHGSLTRVRATVARLGDDLTVEGRDVATWSRQGDVLEVELNAPVQGRVDLDLRWTQAIAAGDEIRQAIPSIQPEAWRSESSLQLARDGEVEVLPSVDEWTAVASAQLPAWGQGLVEGTPTAAYQRSGGTGSGHLDLLRFVPVPGPPTVVDVASYTLATTDEGRVLMKAHYELRNDRGSHLTVVPPKGMRIIGARVAGETALPSRDDDGAWRLPLKRSLETVEGLLSFPVEVLLLGEQEQWDRREQRELALPTLDAPIAAARVTLHLPPRYESRLDVGEHNVVDGFGHGEDLAYGYSAGGQDAAVADALFQEAVAGYMANEFGEAQAKLQELEQLGISNENMARLQSNIDVIEGKADSKDNADLTLQRRVKEQAKARAVEEIRQQESLIEEAEKSAQAGDYGRAEAQYQQALELGNKLAKLEQAESVEQQVVNDDVQVRLSSVTAKRHDKSKPKKGKKARNRGFRSRRGDEVIIADTSVALGGDGTADRDADFVLDGADVPGYDEDLGDLAGNGLDVVVDEIPPSPPPMPEPEPEPEPVYDDYDEEPEPDSANMRHERRSARPLRRSRRRLRTKFKSRSPGGRLRGRAGDGAMPPRIATPARAHEITVDRPMPQEVSDPAMAPPADDPTFADAEGEGDRNEFKDIQEMKKLESEAARLYEMERKAEEQERARLLELERRAMEAAGGEATGEAVAADPKPTIERLPTPTVTASALSMVIPATGTTVRYEQLLLDANQTQTILIDARRRWRR